MKLKKLVFPLLGLLLFACNSDDSEGIIQEEQELATADFIVIGQDLESVYEYTFDGTAETGNQINLTSELNVTPNYLTLREVDDLISFYFFRDEAFSLVIRDVTNGASASYDDFFENIPEQSVAWGINDESSVFFSFFGPSGSRNLGIQKVDFLGNIEESVTVDFDIDVIFQPLILDRRIYFAYRDNQQNYKFTFFNIDSQSIGPTLNFGNNPVSFFTTESGNIAILKNGVNPEIELYDSSGLAFLETLSLDLNAGFDPGPIEGVALQDNRLYYAFPYAQPSRFLFGPAIYDFVNQDNQLLDLFEIFENLENEIGSGVTITTQSYDASQDVFFLGYGIINNSSNGGILQISSSGELIKNIALPFFPTYVVRN